MHLTIDGVQCATLKPLRRLTLLGSSGTKREEKNDDCERLRPFAFTVRFKQRGKREEKNDDCKMLR